MRRWEIQNVNSKVIQDLSQTLRQVLTKSPGVEAPLKGAQIVFDRPSESFKPQQTTVDLFLYDVRENVELRSNEPTFTRSNGQVIVTPPPLRIACSYLVTAWPSGAGEVALLEEQELLGQVLEILSRFPTIPPDFLQGKLKDQDPSMPMVTLQPDGLKNISEFWTSIGNKLRPSLTVTVTASVAPSVPEAGPMVITGEIGLQPLEVAQKREGMFRIGGQVTDKTNKPIEGATVTLVDRGLSAITDVDGRYILGPISTGKYTLRAQAGQATRNVSIDVPVKQGKDYDIQLS